MAVLLGPETGITALHLALADPARTAALGAANAARAAPPAPPAPVVEIKL